MCEEGQQAYYDDDGQPSHTSEEQRTTERDVLALYMGVEAGRAPELWRSSHVNYAREGLRRLVEGYQSLDASRPWLCYWTIQSLDVLDALDGLLEPPDAALPGWSEPLDLSEQLAVFLGSYCQHPRGGIQGGPGMIPHLAPTYAGTNALMAVGTPRCYDAIDRQAVYDFLMSMKTADGAFRMQHDGEADVRSTYCAVAAASAYCLLTPELTAGVADYVRRCQTYEGGLGGEPGNEAHGGYTFCGLAAVLILGAVHVLDLPALLRWAVTKQMPLEGGFQGRTNKLVDSCYSFWVGALFPLLHQLVTDTANSDAWLFDAAALRRYLLVAAQESRGGFKDKPGKGRDFYHTCYSLNGLSVATHTQATAASLDPIFKLKPVDPRYGVCVDKVKRMIDYFSAKPPVTAVSPGATYENYSRAHVICPLPLSD